MLFRSRAGSHGSAHEEEVLGVEQRPEEILQALGRVRGRRDGMRRQGPLLVRRWPAQRRDPQLLDARLHRCAGGHQVPAFGTGTRAEVDHVVKKNAFLENDF